ncbi:MAG: sodium-dependent transporter [Endomicrobium sp.]|jgi:NSS family neurotransmitter:Na+ symporter|nr:sodium-dependent transporter [Endomicrobium sp.]
MGTIKDSFSGKWGLIFSAAGSAIGLGNIWLFPYRLAESGGATFMIPYIICLSIVGVIAVIGEISIGRLTGTGPVGAFKKALELRKKNGKIGEFFGWICVSVALVQSAGYILVVSWVIRFLVGSFVGTTFNASNSAQYFYLVEHTEEFFWICITVLIAAVTIAKGVKKGIEKSCKLMIPAIIVLLLFLAVRVAFLQNAVEGYKYLFSPKWKYLFYPKIWMLALGQVFYSLSLRGSTVVVYGSYTNKSDNIVSSAKHIVALDTIASIIASLLIIPAVFAFGENLNSGESLMFITMPNIFKNIAFGQFLMVIFFTAVFFAALTSLVGMLEVVIEVLQSRFKINRILAVCIVSVVTVFMCNFFVVGNIRKFMDVLELHLIPLCTLVCGIFIFWIVPGNKVIEEIQSGHPKPLGKWIMPMGRYTFCSIIILLYVLNVL